MTKISWGNATDCCGAGVVPLARRMQSNKSKKPLTHLKIDIFKYIKATILINKKNITQSASRSVYCIKCI